jgi:hypothetical protein
LRQVNGVKYTGGHVTGRMKIIHSHKIFFENPEE